MEQVSGDFRAIQDFGVLNGLLTFAGQDEHGFTIFHGDKTYGPFDNVYALGNCGNKPAFMARKDKLTFHVGDEVVAEAQDFKRRFLSINGKPAYAFQKDDRWHAAFDGATYGPYDNVEWLTNVNGFLAFAATKGDKSFCVLDGKELPAYQAVGALTCVNKQLAYGAQIAPNKQHMVLGDRKLGTYEYVGDALEHKGKFAYLARHKPQEWTVVHDEEEHATFQLATMLQSFNQLTFYALQKNRWKIVEGKDYHPEHLGIGFAMLIGKKLGYIAQDKQAQLIVDKQVVLEQPSMNLLRSIHDKPCTTVSALTQFPIWKVWWGGQTFSEEFKQVGDIVPFKKGFALSGQKPDNNCAIFVQD